MDDQAQAYPGPDPQLPETVQQSQRVKQQQQYQQQLWSICKPYVGSDAPMRVLCQRVERFLPELFTFTADPRAAADNNAAERSLRPTVVSRKISGGTRSERGSETKSVLASWFGTWRLRGCNPYHALNSILSQPISRTIAKLFDSGRQPRGWQDSKVGTVDSRFRGKDGLGQIPPCGKTLQSS